jgi:hypothetical protein
VHPTHRLLAQYEQHKLMLPTRDDFPIMHPIVEFNLRVRGKPTADEFEISPPHAPGSKPF